MRYELGRDSESGDILIADTKEQVFIARTSDLGRVMIEEMVRLANIGDAAQPGAPPDATINRCDKCGQSLAIGKHGYPWC